MKFRVQSWRNAFLTSLLITALATVVPIVVVWLALWSVPLQAKWGVLVIAGVIPLLIAFPISMFAMYVVKTLHHALGRLDELVRFDPLTGLWQRAHFLREVEQHRNKKGYLALLDADRFKAINDTYGHEAGDAALKHLASTMAEVLGPNGDLARFGGEEFAVRLPMLNRIQVELLLSAFGTRLRSEGFVFRGQVLRPTMSMGVVAEDGTRTVSELLRAADFCLYRAKALGRDRYVFEELDERQALTA